jgi:hypothetical protein
MGQLLEKLSDFLKIKAHRQQVNRFDGKMITPQQILDAVKEVL